jgi:uncharacterized membrane protein YqjE
MKLEKPESRERTWDAADGASYASCSTPELLRRFAQQSAELVRKEVTLAHAELRANVRQEVGAAKGLGVAGIGVIAAFTLLLVAAVDAIADRMEQPLWAVALVGAGLVAAAAAVIGGVSWSRRVKQPLERTRRTLQDDVQWAKHGLT